MNNSPINWTNFFKHFSPLFILLIIIPLFLFLAFSPQGPLNSTRAANNSLRIWFEPNNLILLANQQAQVDIVANFDYQNSLISDIALNIKPNPYLALDPILIKYNQPFQGQIILGKLTVGGTIAGDYQIDIGDIVVNTPKGDQVIIDKSPLDLKIK